MNAIGGDPTLQSAELGALLARWQADAQEMLIVCAEAGEGSNDHPILHVNQAFEQHSGLSLAQLRGRDPRCLRGSEPDESERARLRAALRQGCAVQVTLSGRDRHQRACWMALSVTPVRSASGARLWVAQLREQTAGPAQAPSGQTLGRDAELERRVTERCRELQAAVSQLEAFGRSMAHDLVNPLSTLRGFVELLSQQHGAELSDEARRKLSLVQRSAEQMDAISQGLLALNRVARMPSCPVQVDVAALCQALVAGLRAAEPQRKVRLRMPQSLVLDADPQLLQLCLEQLVANAWTFSAVAEQPTITVAQHPVVGGVVLTVSDNGPGFPAADAGELFLPFRTLATAGAPPGRGLGLALAARLADRLGGWIWAEGRPGAGADFHLYLPQAAGAMPAPGGPVSEP